MATFGNTQQTGNYWYPTHSAAVQTLSSPFKHVDYELPVDANVTSITAYLKSTSGGNVKAVIYAYVNPSEAGNILGITEASVVPVTAGQSIILPFSTPLALTAGKYYLSIITDAADMWFGYTDANTAYVGDVVSTANADQYNNPLDPFGGWGRSGSLHVEIYGTYTTSAFLSKRYITGRRMVRAEELRDMRSDPPALNTRDIDLMRRDRLRRVFDIKRPSQTWEDGVPTHTFTVIETRDMEFQPLPPYGGAQGEIEIGGVREIPQFHAWFDTDCDVSALDYVTDNSGTFHYFVMRVYEYEDHQEADLIQKEPT